MAAFCMALTTPTDAKWKALWAFKKRTKLLLPNYMTIIPLPPNQSMPPEFVFLVVSTGPFCFYDLRTSALWYDGHF